MCYNVTLRPVSATIVAEIKERKKNITHPECVFVALVIQHAMRMRHIVICSLPISAIFFHIIS